VNLTASEMITAFRQGTLSPVEVVQVSLERLDAWEPHVNAFVFVDREGAIAEARRSEVRWRNGAPLGLLDGVPVAVKDLVAVAGAPIRRGSLAWPEGSIAEADSPVVARLREAGAVLIGKTATPDSGCKIVTESAVHGVTRNPYGLERTPGGSSGGSCVAVATGVVPIAIATDGAGSIRIPASNCNNFGLKPSFGRVPIHPPTMFAPHAVTGPVSLSVEDTALAYNVVTRTEPRDPYALPFDPKDWRDSLGAPIKEMRVALSFDLGSGVAIDRSVRGAIESTAQCLRDLGAYVEEVDIRWPCDVLDTFLVFWRTMYWNSYRGLSSEQQKLVDPLIRSAAEQGSSIGLDRYLSACNARQAMAQAMQIFHQTYDVLLTPVMPVPPYAVGRATPTVFAEDDWSWCPFTYPFNLTQQPAASVPAGRAEDGLPIGAQLVAATGNERILFQAAYAIEQARPWKQYSPAFP
jgi:aspartyl-tRNA(Asn)/glutamyl-tRNA(Gln) amidotransferase subunit A